MGGLTKPAQVKDPRNDLAQTFSNLMQAALGNNPDPIRNIKIPFGGGQTIQIGSIPDMMNGALGKFLTDNLSLPGYQGQLTAGADPNAQAITTLLNNDFARIMGGGQSDQALQNLQNLVNGGTQGAPQDIQQLLGNLPGSGTLQGMANGSNPFMQSLQQLAGQQPQFFAQAASLLGGQGNQAIGQLLGNSNVNTPERQLLLNAAGGNPLAGAQGALGQAQDALSGLMGNQGIQQLLAGNTGTDINSIFSALDAQRRQGLEQDVNNIREQFSSQGLRQSSNLANAIGQRQTASEQNLMAEMARISPQLAGTQMQGQLGALQSLAGIGGQMGQIGATLGNLGLGQQQNVLSGLGQAGQLGLSGAQIGNQALGQAGQLQLGENQNQSGLAQALAGLGLQQQGQSGNILNALLGNQQNAAGQLGQQGLGSAGILAQLFQGNQSNALQAALGLPGAISGLNQMPFNIGQQLFGMNDFNRQIQQAGLTDQYNEFQRQQGLLNSILGFAGGTQPSQLGPSPLDNMLNVAKTGIGAAALKGG